MHGSCIWTGHATIIVEISNLFVDRARGDKNTVYHVAEIKNSRKGYERWDVWARNAAQLVHRKKGTKQYSCCTFERVVNGKVVRKNRPVTDPCPHMLAVMLQEGDAVIVKEPVKPEVIVPVPTLPRPTDVDMRLLRRESAPVRQEKEPQGPPQYEIESEFSFASGNRLAYRGPNGVAFEKHLETIVEIERGRAPSVIGETSVVHAVARKPSTEAT